MKAMVKAMFFLGVLGLCVCAMAENAEGPKQGRKIGRVKHKELMAALDAQLEELDRDKNDKLDHGELRRSLAGLRKTLQNSNQEGEIDLDNDGKIDHGELKKDLDADKDNRIDHGELRKALIQLKQSNPQSYDNIVAFVEKSRAAQTKGKREKRRENRREGKHKE